MSVPILTFFNNKGGVGKTSLVYHLSWMFSELGLSIVAVDLDAQANLTAAFLNEDDLESLWERQSGGDTIFQAIAPLTELDDIKEAAAININPRLHLVAGDVALATFEDTLSEAWPKSLDERNLKRPFRILTSFWQIAQKAAKRAQADLILVDVGPNLGAINRSALIASDYVAIPLGADLFSLQGLKNLGPTLRGWRGSWKKRLQNWAEPDFSLPSGSMTPLGYLVQQHSVRLGRPVKAYDKWINRMPGVYAEHVLQTPAPPQAISPANDPHCLATLRHYRSLIPMAQEARKPIFALTPADGAIGSHGLAVQEARADFVRLAKKLLDGIRPHEVSRSNR